MSTELLHQLCEALPGRGWMVFDTHVVSADGLVKVMWTGTGVERRPRRFFLQGQVDGQLLPVIRVDLSASLDDVGALAQHVLEGLRGVAPRAVA